MSRVFRASWYRFRATFRHEWASYLTIALLLGLVGGLAMGSLAAARRTQSSYSALLETTNPSQIVVATAIASPTIGNGQGYDPAIVREITRVPARHGRGECARGSTPNPSGANGAPIGKGLYTVQAGSSQGSVGGEYFAIDRLAISAGRAADPARVDEFMTSSTAAAAYGFHVGEIIPMGFYTNSQTDLPGFGTAMVKPYRRIDMRLVGIGLPVTEIVTDDVDAGGALALFHPSLDPASCLAAVSTTPRPPSRWPNPDEVAGADGRHHESGTRRHASRLLATAEDDEGKADRAIKPLSIALGVFGGITALAALLIALQVIGQTFAPA